MFAFIGGVHFVAMIYTLLIEEAYLEYFTTLIYHKVLINNTTEQDTEQDTTYRYDQRSRMPTPVASQYEILINYDDCHGSGCGGGGGGVTTLTTTAIMMMIMVTYCNYVDLL